MICPKCGSNNVITKAETETSSVEKMKGFGWVKACLGYLIVGPFGILCGLCGMGKGKIKTSTRSKVVHICQDCGKQF